MKLAKPIQMDSPQIVGKTIESPNPDDSANLIDDLRAQLEEKVRLLNQKQEELEAVQSKLKLRDEELLDALAEIVRLKNELFGPKSEKLTKEQEDKLRELVEDTKEQSQRPDPVSKEVLQEFEKQEKQDKKDRNNKPKRWKLPPVQLETQVEILEPESWICPTSGMPRKKIGEEVTTEYDLIPAKLILRKIIRPKYAPCKNQCCQGILIAPLPPRLLPQSKLGLELAVYILLSHFDDHLSYYALERIFAERHGAQISRQQMVQWVEKIAFLLLAVYNRIWEHMKTGPYMQIDETPVKLMDPETKGKTAKGYLWFYAVPGGDVFLEFNTSRGLQTPLKRLEGFQGTIQADGYVVYDSLIQKLPGIERIGCLAHARRKFYAALKEDFSHASEFIRCIRKLYQIESETEGALPEIRHQRRQEEAIPIWKQMKAKADELTDAKTHLPKSNMGKALSYFLNEYDALVVYLKDPRFQIDNNLIENEVRPLAVGRRRWLFIGHPDAGWRSAVIYTIIQSCRRRGINLGMYLTDVLKRLSSMTIDQVEEIVPAKWKPLPDKQGG